ncbi:uncharacterized membrane protein YcaP (DUF421 family) [Orenia metallireducens]|jgi:uncharacterized membrane protein YcaP (DUF421 family)|uniref:Uncharacterized membrane protein YcaP, DUF421 family n=1 Tax=Orenia metallireducens TaxID=1413210 RepID=A0A285IBZ3_9FIRM|nr:DUF421 domain-containing protein [Orenia metallireducens]PRX28030.1 uncharacterized membrane protein YcaP (DUF421 family) [Orenia metallireducens]SNY45495.1 Uncharacterized membrane protein YcaP, DUF421 family [Orenia metallireducens]
MELKSITSDLLIGFIALFLLTKLLGRRQIRQLTAFDFIFSIVLGELLGNAIYDPEVNFLYILYTLSLWGLLMFGVQLIEQKSIKLRKFISGNPAMVIREGQIDYKKLKETRMNITQLRSLLRQESVFSLKEVEYAILETDGELSVLKKSDHEQVTRKDLNIPGKSVKLPIILISDGQVLWQNIHKHNLTKKWLEQELLNNNIHRFDDVLYAEWSEGEELYVIPFS